MQKTLANIVLGATSILMLFVSTASLAAQKITADVGYVSTKNYTSVENQVNPIRLKAIKETATTLGARGGLAYRGFQINQSLKDQARELDQIFNFNQLLINNNVLPPVLVTSNNNANLSSQTAIRYASKTYKIITPARFVTAAPTWRTYLWMSYKKPELPDKTLLPNTKAEAEVWNKYIRTGWEQGLEQANAIFDANLNRLKRDYMGIVLYRKLLAQGMVSAPYIAKANLGVTGDSKEIRIDDRVMRITKGSALQPDSKQWKAIITK